MTGVFPVRPSAHRHSGGRTLLSLLAALLFLVPVAEAATDVTRSPPAVPAADPAAPPARPSPSPELARGQLLYENHCQDCHASTLHVQHNRRARTRAELSGWVARWSGERRLNWSNEDIDDVVDYLNRRFYRLPPPPAR